MNSYQGYSLISNSSDSDKDFWEEYLEKMAQKAKMKKMIEEELEVHKRLFHMNLQHSYAISFLSQEQQALSNNVHNQFDGTAKNALTDRLNDNIVKAHLLDRSFQRFLDQFS